ncbi:MAG TPA: hypothetical protein VJJ52_08005 [Candidatus Nanoarchaeia archaeon]|nr:hypothetical protein [Candidatus Nanoarchaeia archaeon]
MDEEYNWTLILKSSVPIAAVEAYIFYTNIGDVWKWSALAIGISLSAMIVYMNEKKKSSIFTSAAIVLLVVLIIKLLKSSEII